MTFQRCTDSSAGKLALESLDVPRSVQHLLLSGNVFYGTLNRDFIWTFLG